MSEQSQHPAVVPLWNKLAPILLTVHKECRGLKSEEFDWLKLHVPILNAVITTGELPPGITMTVDGETMSGPEPAKPADNGEQAEAATPPQPQREAAGG